MFGVFFCQWDSMQFANRFSFCATPPLVTPTNPSDFLSLTPMFSLPVPISVYINVLRLSGKKIFAGVGLRYYFCVGVYGFGHFHTVV